jgi:hypothetical protein
MRKLLRSFGLAVTAPLLLASCVAPVKMDLAQQSEYAKKDVGLSNVYNAYRCQYLRTLIGNSGEWYGGFCFMAKNTVYLRMIDSTNPANARYLKIPKSEMKSYSVHTSKSGSELQIRADDFIYGIVITNDIGKPFNDGTMTFANEIGSWGVPLVDTSDKVPVKQYVPMTTVIPIFIPSK